MHADEAGDQHREIHLADDGLEIAERLRGTAQREDIAVAQRGERAIAVVEQLGEGLTDQEMAVTAPFPGDSDQERAGYREIDEGEDEHPEQSDEEIDADGRLERLER